MNTTAASKKKKNQHSANELPVVRMPRPVVHADWATIIGFVSTFLLIVAAAAMGSSTASFFNVPSLLIVFFGTVTATAIAFSAEELAGAGHVFVRSFSRRTWSAADLAYSLIDLAVIAKKQGILMLGHYEDQLKHDAFLSKAMQMVVDGYTPDNAERVLQNEIESLEDRHKRSADIARRAAEIAPAMGLIGTLVGLVQMLSDLENPEMLGPAMAVAILTTLYGAVLGMVFMSGLAAKLDRNSEEETTIKTLIKLAVTSIARQDNPRQLEMILNAELPPAQRIEYFD